MSIQLHCEACKKKIKAPDTAGGKWGNCPFCKHRCYIPLPKSDDEPELKLAPIDPSDETSFDQLMRETKTLTQTLLQQNAVIEEPSGSEGSTRTAQEKEIIKQCILYLRQMADGELGPAASTLSDLKKNKKIALRLLSSMARTERPEPELADLSNAVLQGLIRDASAKLS
ncbi:MAG: hypothetical protein L0Y36_02885 [Planctomycetales bacterium]|nr:hypothetical protein [Planctomycetales bacterium]